MRVSTEEDVQPDIREEPVEERRNKRLLPLRAFVNDDQFLTGQRLISHLESFCFDNGSKFPICPYGINLVTIDSVLLNDSKSTGWKKIQLDLTIPSIDKSEKWTIDFNVPSMHFIIDINAEKLIGSKGVPIGVEKIALLSWKCFGKKLKRTPDPYNGLYEQVMEYKGQQMLVFVRHKLTLLKKNGLAEYDDKGVVKIRKEAEIIDFAAVTDEEFKKTDNGLPYTTGLTAQDKLLIQKSDKWKK